MLYSDEQLWTTIERIARFQAQMAPLRQAETNVINLHAAASGFLAELDRMQLDVREYLSLHPSELQPSA